MSSSSSWLSEFQVNEADIKPNVKREHNNINHSLLPFHNTKATAIDVEPELIKPDESDLVDRHTKSDKQVIPIRLKTPHDIALFYFLQQVAQGMQLHPTSVWYYFNFDRFKSFAAGRYTVDTPKYELDFHGYVDIINFSLLRSLAALRHALRDKSITLTTMLYCQRMRNDLVTLVLEQCEDVLVDCGILGKGFDNLVATSQKRQVNLQQLVSAYRSKTTLSLRPDVHLPPHLDVSVSVDSKDVRGASLDHDPDEYITPRRPFIFFVRLTLQAMNIHDLNARDGLKANLENLNVSHEEMKKSETHDTSAMQLVKMGMLGTHASSGFRTALSVVQNAMEKHNVPKLVAFEAFLSWMSQEVDRIAVVAHLVATCANSHRVASSATITKVKTIGARCSELQLGLAYALVEMAKT